VVGKPRCLVCVGKVLSHLEHLFYADLTRKLQLCERKIWVCILSSRMTLMRSILSSLEVHLPTSLPRPLADSRLSQVVPQDASLQHASPKRRQTSVSL
jgi:hypothetical protein